MGSSGLGWLAEGAWPGSCLVFVRSVSEDHVLRAFGADPGEAVRRPPGDPVPVPEGMTEDAPVIRVGPAGDWLIVLEDDIPPQGTRAEVLRRVSAGGGEAVALYQDIGKFNHEFLHAYDGEIITTVTTVIPTHWGGTQPDRLRPLAEELGLEEGADSALSQLEVLLALAEGVFGLRLSPPVRGRPMRTARLLPPLDDPPRPLPPGHEFHIRNDPVLDLLLNRADRPALDAIAAVRIRRLMAETDLVSSPELVAAVQDAIAGRGRPPADEDPVGRVLRRLARELEEAQRYQASLVNGHRPPFPVEELPLRIRRGLAARLVRELLDGDHPGRILVSEMTDRQLWGDHEPLSLRQRAIADFRDVEVPPADLRAAEDAWLADPEPVRGRRGAIDPEPVREHVAALIAAGLDPARIAELAGGITPVFLDRLLNGNIPQVRVQDARNLLLIPCPS